MKKKVLLVLSLFMLAACDNNSSVSNSAKPSESTSVSTLGSTSVASPSASTSVVAPKTHAVVLPNNVIGAHVTASTLVQEENESVVVTVAMTRDDYELVEVKLGETKLNGVVDEHNDRVNHFTFQMGTVDAVITVTTKEVVPPTKDHTISFKDNDFAFVMGLPTEANVGDVVEFKVAVQSGYELTSVAAKAGEDNVEVTGDPVTGYQFEMPDSDVVVDATVLGAYFKVNVGDAVVTEEESTKEYEMVEQLISSEGEVSISSSTRSVFLRAGEKVTLRADRNSYVTADNYFVDGVALALKADSEYLDYEFTMPAHNANITVEGKVREVPLAIEKGEHTTAKIYRMVDGAQEEVTSAKVGEKLYVEATSSDAAFPISKISGAYKTYSPSYSSTESDGKMTETDWGVEPSGYSPFTFESANVMSFTLTARVYVDALTIKLTETDLARFNAIKGTWTAITFETGNTSSNKGKIKGTDDWSKWTISETGEATRGSTAFTLDESDFTNEHVAFKSSSGATRKLYFNGNIAWAYDGFEIMASGSPNPSISKTNIQMFARDVEFTNISYAQYGRNYENEQSLIVLTNKTTNAEIGNLFIDHTGKGSNGDIYINVDVEMLKGTSVAETGAAFKVSKDGAVLATIGIGAEKGTYTNATSGNLVLDGLGNATLDGVAGTYATVDGKMELTVAEKTYIVTLSSGTYTMTEKVVVPEGPEYCGTWSGESDTGVARTITINSDNTLVYSMYPSKTLNYTVDESVSWKVTITCDSGIYGDYMLVITYNRNTKKISYELIDAADLYADAVESGSGFTKAA